MLGKKPFFFHKELTGLRPHVDLRSSPCAPRRPRAITIQHWTFALEGDSGQRIKRLLDQRLKAGADTADIITFNTVGMWLTL